jgi:hypothetical protein
MLVLTDLSLEKCGTVGLFSLAGCGLKETAVVSTRPSRKMFKTSHRKRRPASLVARSATASGIGVKIFMKQN